MLENLGYVSRRRIVDLMSAEGPVTPAGQSPKLATWLRSSAEAALAGDPEPVMPEFAPGELEAAIQVAVTMFATQNNPVMLQEQCQTVLGRSMTPAEEHSRQELVSVFRDLAHVLLGIAEGEPVTH